MIFSAIESIIHFALLVIEKGGYLGVFALMFLESANIPLPSEVIMSFSGFLVGKGFFNFWLVILAGAFGDLIGSLFSYWLGYLVRTGVLHWNNHKTSSDIERAKSWIHRFGSPAIFISRLLPLVRTFFAFPLGILKVNSIWKFSLMVFLGAFIWSTFLTYLGFIFGENWQILGNYFRKFDYLVLVIFLILLILFIVRHFKNKEVVANS